MTYAEFFENLNNGARWDIGVSINRSNSLPLDANSVFASLEAAQKYVAGTPEEGTLANAYPGQILAVVSPNATTIYYVDVDAEGKMNLKEVGPKLSAADASIEIVDGKITLGGFAGADAETLPRKKVNEDGTTTIEWVPISAIVQGDGNTITKITPADSSVEVLLGTDTEAEKSYTVKMKVSEAEGNSVEVKEDGIYVATPEAYDDTQIKEDIKKVEDLVGTTSVDSQIDAKIEALKLSDTYAEKQHTHNIDEVNGLQEALDNKQVAGDYATKAEAQGYADAKDEAIAAAKKAGDDAQADVDELKDRVSTVEGAITTLNGDSTVEGSVDKKITDAINAFATEVSDNGTIDKFKEIVDYFAEHSGDGAEMAAAIESLETKVGEKSVSVQIQEAIAKENLSQYATNDRVQSVEDEVSTLKGKVDVNKVSEAIAAALAEAKQYADDNDTDTIYNDTELRGRIETLEGDTHKHDNAEVLTGITAEKVTAWDAAEENAKKHATDLNEAMDLRVKTVEEKAHTHENEAVLVGITAEKVAAWDSAEENAKSAADTALTEATAAINETIQELTNTVNEKATSEALKTVSDKLDSLAGIKTLDQELVLDEQGVLSIDKVAADKVSGLKKTTYTRDEATGEWSATQTDATLAEILIPASVDASTGIGQAGLLTPEDKEKLAALILGEGGNVEISGQVNVDNVVGLPAYLNAKIDKILINGEEVSPSVNGTGLGQVSSVNIPLATAEKLGVVKSTALDENGKPVAENAVMVQTDGTMRVGNLNVNKLVQTEGEEFILNGGSASGTKASN